MKGLGILIASLLAGACVPVDEIDMGSRSAAQAVRPDGQPFALLDAGASELDSLHFKVRAYGQEPVRRTADSAEAAYSRVMSDTNLFSFQQRQLYQIVVYATQDEYRRKTGQPAWSGGCSVGNAIYTFAGPQQDQTVAHEMTHLIWFEYMGRVNLDHRWVNEGLAVYQQLKTAGVQRQDPFAVQRGTLRATPLTIDQLVHLVPATERENTVALWYAQSEDLVRFMIERGGRMGFSQFLGSLRDGRSLDESVGASFAGQWRTLDDLYQSWQRSLQ
jgi:hypothetical protein